MHSPLSATTRHKSHFSSSPCRATPQPPSVSSLSTRLAPGKGDSDLPARLLPPFEQKSSPAAKLPCRRRRYPVLDDVMRGDTDSRPSRPSQRHAMSPQNPSAHALGDTNRNHSCVRVSPTRGRRARVGRACSTDSSLLVSHPPCETSGLVTDWLDPPAVLSPPVEEEPVETPRCRQKRKRLEAFSPSYPRSISSLKPTELAGMGRIIFRPADVVETDAPGSPSPPKKKRSVKKLADETPKLLTAFGLEVTKIETQYGASAAAPNETSSDADDEIVFEAILAEEGPQWPDSAFPWSQADRLCDTTTEQEAQRRLRRLDAFLDEGDASDADGDASMSHTPWSSADSSTTAVEPSNALSLTGLAENTRDPADAFVALLSNPHARSLYERRQREGTEHDDDGFVHCICGSDDNERAMVRCDACNIWFHQECVGTHDEAVLGGEWYCTPCEVTRIETGSPSPGPLEYQYEEPDVHQTAESLRSSPIMWACEPEDAATLRRPITPPRCARFFERAISASMRMCGGPFTPYTTALANPQLYCTPHFFRDFEPADPRAVMDPATTPSRGLTFDVPFISMSAWDKHIKMEFPSTPPRLASGLVGVPALEFSSSASAESRSPASPRDDIEAPEFASMRQRRLCASGQLPQPSVRCVDMSPSPLGFELSR